MQDIRTITLDLDDTLWAIGPVISRAENQLHAWFAQNYPRITERHTRESILKLRDEIVAEQRENAHDLTFLRRAVITRLGETSGYVDFPVDEAFAVFDAARNDVDLYPDVRPALRSLQKEFTLIAVTNGNANLDKIGIADLFSAVVSAQTAGAAKPDQRIFDVAVDAGGVAAAQTLHVGDHPEIDVAGARNAGLKTVWINRLGADWPNHIAEPDGVVSDLTQLAQMLAEG